MVSSSDYAMLLETGAYEPVKDLSESENVNSNGNGSENGNDKENEQLKEVYGKQKSPYRKLASAMRSKSGGPRSRTVVVSMGTSILPQDDEIFMMDDNNQNCVENDEDDNSVANRRGKGTRKGKGQRGVRQAVKDEDELSFVGGKDDSSGRGMNFENEESIYFEDNLFEDGFEEEDLSQYIQARSDQQQVDSLHKSDDGEEGWSFS